MSKDKINSGESEGIFNDFINNSIKDKIEDIIRDGEFEDNMSDVIIEVNDIKPPIFTFGNGGNGGKGGRIGNESEKLRFLFPFDKFMEFMSEKLQLPDLTKEGRGKIKEVSHEFKTFGPNGIIMDKKRTFKKAIKGSIALGIFDPENENLEIQIRRKDKRFNVPKRVEKPKYKAVCFYIGDISYSTYGERLVLEKKLVNFIYNWLNYNYGRNNVDHRFFVHDWEAHEVQATEFFKTDVAGGTRASVAFDMVNDVARNEYDVGTTNYYAFYFGDGELFGNDADDIESILREKMDEIFNRIGIVEIIPSNYSNLLSKVSAGKWDHIKTAKIKDKSELVKTIKILFGSN